MTPIFPELPVDLGVYTLTRLLGSHETVDRYIARQSHVERSVVIEVLRPDSPKETLDAFLRTARVRVAAHIPHVSQVLETMVSGNLWYITSECPEGVPLSRLREKGKRLGTPQICTVIQSAAMLYEDCLRKNLAAGALTPDAVFVGKDGEVRFLSPLESGTPSPELHIAQLDGLAAALQDVRPEGEAGQTRVATLLEWLGLEFDGQRLEWPAVASTAEYIRDSIAPLLTADKIRPRAAETPYTRKRRSIQRRRSIVKYTLASALCLAGAAGISMLGTFLSPYLKTGSLPAVQKDMVRCGAASGAVDVMAAPVSISDYKSFLDDYETMKPKQLAAVNKGVPFSATNHTPAEWSQQVRAASKKGKKGIWRGEEVGYESPVRGISYWDAVAYANYRNASLPTADVLNTVRNASGGGTCEEWTGTTREADPLHEKSIVVLPGEGGETPLPESDFSAKNTSRGFRLVLPSNPQAKP